MFGLVAYVALLIAAAAAIAILYVVCDGNDRARVRSRSVRGRPMLALFACAASLIAVAAGGVILLNSAIAADKANKIQLARSASVTVATPAVSSVPAVSAVPAVSSVPKVNQRVLADQAEQRPKQKKAAARQARPKPRFAERRQDSYYSRMNERPYNFW